jgi:hypothetical protein
MVYETVTAETRVYLALNSERVPPASGFLTIGICQAYSVIFLWRSPRSAA